MVGRAPAADVARAACEAVLADWWKPGEPGAAVAVIRDGEPVHLGGYGEADLEHRVPISPSTRFGAASISKQFACMCTLIVARDGLLTPASRIREFVPELGSFADEITIEQLMNHTSGIRELWELLTFAGWRWSDLWTHADALAATVAQGDGNFAAGSSWSYSNSGYILLVEALRRATGRSLRSLAEELIFAPLGMDSTCFRDDPREVLADRARGYAPGCDGRFEVSEPNTDIVGTTGLFTTVEDLARWDGNFTRQVVGGPAAIARLTAPARLDDGREIPYGLGLCVRTLDGHRVEEHSGGHSGYRAHYLRLPDDGLGVAVLANTTLPAPAIATAIARRLLDRGEARAWVEPRGSMVVRDGVFRSRTSGYALRIQEKGEGLVLGFDPGDPAGGEAEVFVSGPRTLSPLGDSLRAAVDHDDREVIELSEDGETLVMTYVNGALAQVFERVKEAPAALDGEEVDLGTFRSDELDTELRVALAAGRLRLAGPRLGTLSLESIGPASFACANLTVDLEPDLVRPRLIVVATYGTRRLVFRPAGDER